MPTLMPAPSPTPIVPASASASLVTLVKPGGDQSIVVNGAKPGREIHLQVTFPNGDKLQQAAAADGIGNANFSFLQRPSMITRRNRQARVTLTGVGAGGPFSMVKTYTIGYAPVDVSVQPRTARPGKQVSIWIHGHKRAGIVLTLTLAGNHHRYITSRTGSHGWTRIGYTVPRRLHSGQHIAVHVFLYIFHRTAQTTSTLHIR